MEQLLAHLTGDYLLQNGWISENKHKSFLVALLHGTLYTLPFIFLTQNVVALVIIGLSHTVIDFFQIGHRFMWLQEQLAPKKYRSSWSEYISEFPKKPEYLFFWLRVIVDNTIHLLINFGVLRYM